LDFDPRDDADPRDPGAVDIYDARWLGDPRGQDDRERDVERDDDPSVVRVRRRVLLRSEALLHWLEQKCAPSLEER
jgi:hypothetical protein